MGFGANSYAKLWELENKGNYHVASMTTSRKDRDTGEYEKDWGNKFVRLVGQAHEKASSLNGTERIKLLGTNVTNNYNAEKKQEYTNYVVFDFEMVDGTQTTKTSPSKNAPKAQSQESDDEELPF